MRSLGPPERLSDLLKVTGLEGAGQALGPRSQNPKAGASPSPGGTHLPASVSPSQNNPLSHGRAVRSRGPRTGGKTSQACCRNWGTKRSCPGGRFVVHYTLGFLVNAETTHRILTINDSILWVSPKMTSGRRGGVLGSGVQWALPFLSWRWEGVWGGDTSFPFCTRPAPLLFRGTPFPHLGCLILILIACCLPRKGRGGTRNSIMAAYFVMSGTSSEY